MLPTVFLCTSSDPDLCTAYMVFRNKFICSFFVMKGVSKIPSDIYLVLVNSCCIMYKEKKKNELTLLNRT